MVSTVAAVVGSQVAVFELGIVCQLFGLDRSDEGLPTHGFTVCAARPGPVPSTSGFPVEAAGLDTVAAADVVVVPAWPDLDGPLEPETVEALRAACDRGAQLLAICSGAFALAEAGLLDGRRATTHWQFMERFARRYPKVRVERDVLYVSDGPVLTSAGAAAGIDAGLHLMRRLHGAETANAVARRMVVPAHREGGQAQYVEFPVPLRGSGEVLSGLLDWIVQHLDEPLGVERLAAAAHMSPRTFARQFRARTGTTPGRFVLEQRLHRAEQLLESTLDNVEVVARRVGFGSADTLRHHFARQRGTTPTAHRRAFARA